MFKDLHYFCYQSNCFLRALKVKMKNVAFDTSTINPNALLGAAGCIICGCLSVHAVSMSPIKGSHCLLEQDTLPSLLSIGWF